MNLYCKWRKLYRYSKHVVNFLDNFNLWLWIGKGCDVLIATFSTVLYISDGDLVVKKLAWNLDNSPVPDPEIY